MFSFSSNKNKNCKGFGVKTDRLLKFLIQKMLQNVFYLHRFWGRKVVPYHYWFHLV